MRYFIRKTGKTFGILDASTGKFVAENIPTEARAKEMLANLANGNQMMFDSKPEPKKDVWTFSYGGVVIGKTTI